MSSREKRPQVDERIDAVLTRRCSPAEHRSWWMAESPTLGGFTAKEALEAGFRDAVMDAAEGHPGKVDATPLIAPDFVDAYLRQQDEAPSPSWRRAAERRPGA